MLQLIDKQKLIFCLNNIEFQFVKPNYIMLSTEFKLRKAVVKGSTMVWNIKRNEVSYNQLKNLIKNNEIKKRIIQT